MPILESNYYELEFEHWYKALVKLAQAEELSYLISNDPQDHWESWNDGNTPQEELDEQIYSAKAGM